MAPVPLPHKLLRVKNRCFARRHWSHSKAPGRWIASRFNDFQGVVVNYFEDVLVISVKPADVNCVVGLYVPISFWRTTALTSSLIVKNELALAVDAIVAPTPLAAELRGIHNSLDREPRFVGGLAEL